MINKLVGLLRQARFSLERESECQREIGELLEICGVACVREHRLDSKNILDFFINGIAIEVKLKKGAAKAIYKQCERYCQFDDVKALILVTNRPMGFPPEINGKPCYVVSLGRGWL